MPAGNVIFFITSTCRLFFIYVGDAPFFINSTFPSYKSNIAISSVAYESSSEFRHILEFIISNDVSLLNPDTSNLFSICTAILLLFLAFGPEPIPSLIAINCLPSCNFIFNVVSPETGLPSFLALASPICNLYLFLLIYLK